jgi:hypothetical protein
VPYGLRARRFRRRSCCIAATILLSKLLTMTQRLSYGAEARKRELRVVLSKLEQIRECLWQAEQCAQRAAERPSGSPLRQAFTQLAKRWLGLARSIEFGEKIDHSRTNAETINRTQSH